MLIHWRVSYNIPFSDGSFSIMAAWWNPPEKRLPGKVSEKDTIGYPLKWYKLIMSHKLVLDHPIWSSISNSWLFESGWISIVGLSHLFYETSHNQKNSSKNLEHGYQGHSHLNYLRLVRRWTIISSLERKNPFLRRWKLRLGDGRWEHPNVYGRIIYKKRRNMSNS